MSRILRVAAARDLGPQFVDNPHRIIGQDGAFSIPLDENRALWFFGDTLIGQRPAGESLWYINGTPVGPADMTGRGGVERMITNSGLVLRNGTGRNGLRDYSYILDQRRQVKPLIPLAPHEHPDHDRIWCQHGLWIDGSLYLSFIKVKMLRCGDSPYPVVFEIVGSGLAVGGASDWTFRRITGDGTDILWQAHEPHFATAILHEPGDRYIYMYGTVKQGAVQNCYLARVRSDSIEQLNQYRYLKSAEPGWTSSLADAAPLFSGMPSELSISFNTHLDCYLAVHSLDLSGDIVARTASRPWGPWSEPALLWRAAPHHAKPARYPLLIYAGKEHPELAEDNGRIIYLTYIEFEEYWPHLIEITLT